MWCGRPWQLTPCRVPETTGRAAKLTITLAFCHCLTPLQPVGNAHVRLEGGNGPPIPPRDSQPCRGHGTRIFAGPGLRHVLDVLRDLVIPGPISAHPTIKKMSRMRRQISQQQPSTLNSGSPDSATGGGQNSPQCRLVHKKIKIKVDGFRVGVKGVLPDSPGDTGHELTRRTQQTDDLCLCPTGERGRSAAKSSCAVHPLRPTRNAIPSL